MSSVNTTCFNAENAEKCFWGAAGTVNIITDFFTQGLADFLGLETLRHGTSWRNYVSIRVHGADPQYSGTGSSQGLAITRNDNVYIENSQGRFFVNRDSSTIGTDFNGNIYDIRGRFDYKAKDDQLGFGVKIDRSLTCGEAFKNYMFVRGIPRFYAYLSGYNEAAEFGNNSACAKAKRVANGCLSILAPSVKFRFRPEEMQTMFEDDDMLRGIALRTTHKINTDYLGIKGIFLQGSEGNIMERMKAHPGKTLVGLARLINPIGILLLLAFGIYLGMKRCCASLHYSRVTLQAA